MFDGRLITARHIRLDNFGTNFDTNFDANFDTNYHFCSAGGIRNLNDVKNWICLVRYYLGDEYLNPSYFRLGASSLLGELEQDLFRFIYNREPSKEELCV